MTITCVWNIEQLNRRTSDGFVKSVDWECTAEESPYSARSYSTTHLDGELTTPYESLTKEQVLEWVWQTVDKDATEASLASQIEAQKNPVSATGVPW